MEITYCEGCNTKYNIGGLDEGSRFKCKQCGEVITVSHEEGGGNDFDFSDLGIGDDKPKKMKAKTAGAAVGRDKPERAEKGSRAARGGGGGRPAARDRAPRAPRPATPVPFVAGMAMALIGVVLMTLAPGKAEVSAWESSATSASAALEEAASAQKAIIDENKAKDLIEEKYQPLSAAEVAAQLKNKSDQFRNLAIDQLDRGVGAIPRAGREQGELVRNVVDRVLPACLTVYRKPDVSGGDPRDNGWNASGVIIGADGTAVTEYAIAANQTQMMVLLSSGDIVTATVVGGDASTNVTLLKLDDFERVKQMVGANCVANFGPSAGLTTGDQLVLIGSPHGMHGSVVVGYASQPRRYLPEFTVEPYNARVGETFSYIHFDASMQDGSKGAPLCDARGNVVGIASRRFDRWGQQFELIGLGVPSEAVQRTIRNIKETAPLKSRGEIPWDTRWSWIGTVFSLYEADLNKPLRDDFHPLKVTFVSMGSSAEAEGVKAGDLILSIDGEKVKAVAEEDIPQYTLRIAETTPGATITLEIERDGTKRTIKVKADPKSPFSGTSTELWRAGLVVTQATPSFAQRMNLQNVQYGVYVVRNQTLKRMRFAGALYQFGGNIVNSKIEAKFVITEINGTKITSVGQMLDIYNEIAEDSGSPSVSAKVIDANGRTQSVSFNLAKIEDLVVTQGR